LKVAGQGDYEKIVGYPKPDFVDIVGYVEPTARRELLKGARALIAPTHYNEPFGGVSVEAMLCGTPVICSDWGGFTDNVLHGITGYRCRSMDHFVWAVKNIHRIDRKACRAWAVRNFSLERIALMYEEYFQGIIPVFKGKGFYTENAGRKELDWMKREYPCTK
jgi:glycosyltransferase involved in cell wall biosynthesis